MSNERTALLLMDFQLGIGEQARAGGAVAAALKARAAARAAKVRTIFVKVGFASNYPEVGAETPVFSAARQAGKYVGEASRLLEEFTPEPDEAVVDKKRFSAFAGSSLEMILRAQDIRSLVLAGVSTSGVVLSTLRHAFDMEYRMTVLSDACMDPDPVVHELLMTKVYPRQARICTAEDWGHGL